MQILELYTQADSLLTIFMFVQADWQRAKAHATNDRHTVYHGYQPGSARYSKRGP